MPFSDPEALPSLEESEEARLRDPATALDLFRNAVHDWNTLDPEAPQVPVPDEVLEVVEVACSYSRRSGTRVRARVRAGGSVGMLTVVEETDYGSREEPPDYECNVEWESS